jgi:WASH complex subunit 7
MEKYYNISPSSCFPSNVDDVGILSKNLMVFDEIFRNSDYKTYLQLYGELISQQEGQMDENVLRNLQNTLHEIALLLDGNIFQIAIDNLLTLKSKITDKSLKRLESFLLIHIKNLMNGINLFDHQNISDLIETEEVVKLNIFIVIYQKLFGNFDPKSLRTAAEINNNFCVITIFNFMWNGNEFLKQNVPSLFKSNLDVAKIQQNFLSQKVQSLIKDGYLMFSQISLWIIQMQKESQLGNENIDERTLKLRCEILYQGLVYAGQISFMLKSIINLHMKFSLAMPKQLIPTIYKLIEYLRTIKNTYHTHSVFIVDSIGFVFQYLQFHTLNVIGACKKKVMIEAKKEKKFDLSSSLALVEKLLYGTVSVDRLNAISLALNLSEPVKSFGSEYLSRLLKLLDHQMTLCKLQANIEKLCEPSFLFWNQNLVSAYLKQIIDNPLQQGKLNLLLESAGECLSNLKCLQLDNVQSFHPFVKQELEENVITKLCNSIEIHLRLDFHSNLQVDKFNPFEINNKITIEDRRALIALSPAMISNEYISIRDHVEHYLSKMFYNLTTISLKDWRTYGEMRYLAERKYSLETVDDHLPTQTLDQGLDVLEIMRNIHLFVARYNYNLNNQVFVEQSSKNQHLNTINIRNIANSLRTHGNGIVNTAVNYVYQFLRKKFNVFSQFIFDERIKSRLAKDLKFHRDQIDKNNQVYSYDRANIFNRDIKKLGMNEKGESFLDQFRMLITQIGNSMGYIRMIRSGMNHVGAQASVCLPTLDDDLEFVSLCQEEKLSETTLKAAQCLEEDIKHLSKNYEEGMLFFKVKLKEFSSLSNYNKLFF